MKSLKLWPHGQCFLLGAAKNTGVQVHVQDTLEGQSGDKGEGDIIYTCIHLIES